MIPLFLGIDVAGASNTWVCGITPGPIGPEIALPPRKMTMAEIVGLADEGNVLAIALDAQLTHAISEENGFRSCDNELRQMLPKGCRDWVASQNSLMAVPVRGRQLADALAPVVGTILETHPRACLYLGFPELLEPIRLYKKDNPREHLALLWQSWTSRFGLSQDTPTALNDGKLDSLICATVAYLYHSQPDALLRLKSDAKDRTGRGPFFVTARTQGVSRQMQGGVLQMPLQIASR